MTFYSLQLFGKGSFALQMQKGCDGLRCGSLPSYAPYIGSSTNWRYQRNIFREPQAQHNAMQAATQGMEATTSWHQTSMRFWLCTIDTLRYGVCPHHPNTFRGGPEEAIFDLGPDLKLILTIQPICLRQLDKAYLARHGEARSTVKPIPNGIQPSLTSTQAPQRRGKDGKRLVPARPLRTLLPPGSRPVAKAEGIRLLFGSMQSLAEATRHHTDSSVLSGMCVHCGGLHCLLAAEMQKPPLQCTRLLFAQSLPIR